MNQVYFYRRCLLTSSLPAKSLNPFMNQVYFYGCASQGQYIQGRTSLNPFMNQVYFYQAVKLVRTGGNAASLNPFMNQVYFYSRTAGMPSLGPLKS